MSLNVLGDKERSEASIEEAKGAMDMAFIPKGASESRDYKSYVVRVFKSVPIKSALICENIFTGKATVKKSGLRFVAPWYRSKLVYVGDTQIDYPTYKLLSHDRIQMAVDYTLNLRIINPIKYEFGNQDTLLALNQLTENIMRTFVANHNSDDLFKRSFSLKDIDPMGRYKRFAEKYGLLCTDILYKCDIPKSLKDDYEAKAVAERKQEVARIEADTVRIKAGGEADAIKIKGKAEAEVEAVKLNSWLEALHNNGDLNSEQLKAIQALLFSKTDGHLFVNVGNADVPSIQQEILGLIAQKHTNSQTGSKSSNSSSVSSSDPNPNLVRRK